MPHAMPACAARHTQAEIGAECGRVQRFIIDREIEAPERFQAIQSYRWGTTVASEVASGWAGRGHLPVDAAAAWQRIGRTACLLALPWPPACTPGRPVPVPHHPSPLMHAPPAVLHPPPPHRSAAMAILRQQAAFIDELFASGIVNEVERGAMQVGSGVI